MWQFYYGGAQRDEASERPERDAGRTERAELSKLIASQTDPVGPRRAPETAEDGEVYRLGAALYVGMQEAREAGADAGADEWEVAERAVEADPAVLNHAGTDAFQAAARMSFVEGVLRQRHPDFDGRSRGERIELLRLGARRMDEAWRAVNAFSEFVQGGRVGGRPKRKIPDPQLDLRAAELKNALDLEHREIGEILRVPQTEKEVREHGGNRAVGHSITRGQKLFISNLGEDGYRTHIEAVRPYLRRWHALSDRQRLVQRMLGLYDALNVRPPHMPEPGRPDFERLVEKHFPED